MIVGEGGCHDVVYQMSSLVMSHILVDQQECIGWDQLLLGHFGFQWCCLQDDHLCTLHNKAKTLSGPSWILAITQTSWIHVTQVWELHNKEQSMPWSLAPTSSMQKVQPSMTATTKTFPHNDNTPQVLQVSPGL
jgi:hypothetical protein